MSRPAINKQFSNSSGTTSSEFELGAGFSTNVRHIVLSAVTDGDTNAVDRNGQEIEISGVEFFEIKMLAKDTAGNVSTKQMKGSVTEGGSVYSVEEIYQDSASANITLGITGSTLSIVCAHSSLELTYNIYVSLLRAG